MQETEAGSTLGSERPPGGGHSNPLQHPCLKHPMDRRAWRATVLGVARSRTGLKRFGMHTLTTSSSNLHTEMDTSYDTLCPLIAVTCLVACKIHVD